MPHNKLWPRRSWRQRKGHSTHGGFALLFSASGREELFYVQGHDAKHMPTEDKENTENRVAVFG